MSNNRPLNRSSDATENIEEFPITNEHGPCSVLVKNLQPSPNLEKNLSEFFSTIGKIDAISIREDRTDSSLFEATVRFENHQEAKQAVLLNNSSFLGNLIEIEFEQFDENLAHYADEVAIELGEELENYENQVQKGVENTVKKINEKTNQIGEAVREEGELLENYGNEIKKQAAEKANELSVQINEGAENVKEQTAEKVNEVSKQVNKGVENVKKQTTEKVNEVSKQVNEGVENVKEEAIVLGNDLKEGVENVKEQATEKVNEVSKQVNEGVENVKESAGTVYEQVAEKANELTEQATAMYKQASVKALEIKEGVNSVVEQANQVVNEIQEVDVTDVQEQARRKLTNLEGRQVAIQQNEVVPETLGELITEIKKGLLEGYENASVKVKEIDQIITEKTEIKETLNTYKTEINDELSVLAGQATERAIELEQRMEETFLAYKNELQVNVGVVSEQAVEKVNEIRETLTEKMAVISEQATEKVNETIQSIRENETIQSIRETEHNVEEKLVTTAKNLNNEIVNKFEHANEKAIEISKSIRETESNMEEKLTAYKEEIKANAVHVMDEIKTMDALLLEKIENFDKEYHVSEKIETIREKATELDQTYHIMDKVHQAEETIKETLKHVDHELHVSETAIEVVQELNSGVETGKRQYEEFLEKHENAKKGSEIIMDIGGTVGNAIGGLLTRSQIINSENSDSLLLLEEADANNNQHENEKSLSEQHVLVGVAKVEPEQQEPVEVLLTPRI